MMTWIRAFGAGILLALAAICAVLATRHRQKARALSLLDAVVHSTGAARAHANKALAHLDRAEILEKRATKLTTKGACKDETVASIVDRWNRHSNLPGSGL